jgi:hypothetical protein
MQLSEATPTSTWLSLLTHPWWNCNRVAFVLGLGHDERHLQHCRGHAPTF